MRGIEHILIVDYSRKVQITEGLTVPSREVLTELIRDINYCGSILNEFDNMAFDSLAPLADEVLDFITAIDGKKDTEIQHYKRAIKKLKEIVGAAFSYQKSVVMLSHIQAEKDDITGRAKMNPLVWGKQLPSDIPKLFSEVFHATTESTKDGPKYVWRTQPDSWLGFLGTRRLEKLLSTVEQNFAKLYGEKPQAFSALILGDSHTGKTYSLNTLPGRTILFYLEDQIAGYDSIRGKKEVCKSLRERMK